MMISREKSPNWLPNVMKYCIALLLRIFCLDKLLKWAEFSLLKVTVEQLYKGEKEKWK